jgi:hypothetical protein
MGDRFLNSELLGEHDCGPEEDEALAVSYADACGRRTSPPSGDGFMGAFFEAMWVWSSREISEARVDFVAYAVENFERLRAIGEDPVRRVVGAASTPEGPISAIRALNFGLARIRSPRGSIRGSAANRLPDHVPNRLNSTDRHGIGGGRPEGWRRRWTNGVR